MRFRRIEVRNYKKLLAPVVIDALGDGVTIIAGDNEEGKSTLLDAIRAGLFERHNVSGKAADEKQPFGSAVRPEVRLDFELDGQPYTIEKGFAQKPSARLATPSGTFDGPAAEERLAELLGFRLAQRGGSRAEDQGVLGLLCLEQGRIIEGLRLGEQGRSTIRGALEDEVGDVLGGPRGQRLLEAAKAARNALLTATGKPRGDLKDASDQAEAEAEDLVVLEQARKAYDKQIDELEKRQRDLARIDSDRAIDEARDRLREAERDALAIEALHRDDREASQAVLLATAKVENADERWQGRQRLVDEVTTRRAVAAEASGRRRALEEQTEAVEARLHTARTTLEAAIEARSRAGERAELARRRARIDALARETEDLAARLTAVDRLEIRRREDRQLLAAIAIDAAAFGRIEALSTAIREQEAALRTIATRLRFRPDAGQAITRDGATVARDETVDVTEATRFTLEGFGVVDVEPGARELDAGRQRLADLRGRMRDALLAAGVEDVDAAKVRLEQRKAAESHLEEAQRLLAAYAPEGVEALRAASTDGAAELALLQEGFDPATADDLDHPDVEERAADDARHLVEGARSALDAARSERAAHDTEVARAQAASEAAYVALLGAERDLAAARTDAADADLAATLEVARGALRAAEEHQAGTSRALADADPDEVAGRRQRAADALKMIRAEYDRLRHEVSSLQGSLAALGKDGLEEQLEAVRGRRVQALERRDRLQADADAWELLVSTLVHAERDAKQQFLAPVLARVGPFLRLLLPEARITLGEEDLDITGVERDGRQEPYQSLSVGTREQLSILVRLAFAVYLREKGYPAAVILDDALVYADDDRFDRMQLALRKAADTVQILILTCRPRDWRQFGAPIERLAGSS